MNPLMSSHQSPVTSHQSRLLWYVLKTKPCAEEQVRQRLTKADFEVFYPRIKTVVRGKFKSVTRFKSLFPSYLFARLNLTDADVYHKIRYTRGIHRILGNGDFPVPVPDEMVKVIQVRVNSDGVLEQLVFKKGDSVRIRRGPLRDLIGVLEKPVSAAGRVRVLLEVMRKVVRTELSCSEIERLDSTK